MLKSEIIKGSKLLEALTDEQVKAIEELSKNDEASVLAKVTGDIHGQYDRDIEEATGMKRPDGIKTYEWMKKDVLPKVKSAGDLKKKLEAAKQEKIDLEKQLKDGKIDDATKQKLADNESLINQLRDQLKTEKEDFDKKLEDAVKANNDILINAEFDKALVGKKFKDEKIISKAVRESFVSNAKQSILGEFTPEYIDDGVGGKKLVFKDAKGEIARNKDNGLNPFTADELFTNKIKDVLDLGKSQNGVGSKAPEGGKSGGGALDLSTAKTQVEATDMTINYLMSKGLARGTVEFTEEFDKIQEENKVTDLPLREN